MSSVQERRKAELEAKRAKLEEMKKLSEDREHVELLLRQALGSGLINGHDTHLEQDSWGCYDFYYFLSYDSTPRMDVELFLITTCIHTIVRLLLVVPPCM